MRNSMFITGEKSDVVMFNFPEMFNKEIKAASRGNYPVSVLLVTLVPMDPECFNEDEQKEASLAVYKVAKTKLRDTDSLFFLGKDSLALILPFTNSGETIFVEEKIIRFFETHTLLKPYSSKFKLHIVGICFPEDGKIQSKLLEKLLENHMEYLMENQ